MARRVQPLGRLANGGAFQSESAHLMLFLQGLNALTSPGILFLAEEAGF